MSVETDGSESNTEPEVSISSESQLDTVDPQQASVVDDRSLIGSHDTNSQSLDIHVLLQNEDLHSLSQSKKLDLINNTHDPKYNQIHAWL